MKKFLKPLALILVAAHLVSCNDSESTEVWHYPGDCLFVFPEGYSSLWSLEKNVMYEMYQQPSTLPDRPGNFWDIGGVWFRSSGSLDDTIIRQMEYYYKECDDDGCDSYLSYSSFFSGSFSNTVEVRAANGWSNLGDLFAAGKDYGDSYKFTAVTKVEAAKHGSTNDNSDHSYYDYYITKAALTSPPAYLHLTLDSIFDVSVSGDNFDRRNAPLKFKKWQVDKIMSNGADVTNAAGWSCYADNIYTFRKNGTLKYEPGPVSCDIDQTLASNNLQSVYLNFTLEPEFVDFDNPGKISLSFDIPPLKPGVQLDPEDFTFEILSSDFQNVVFKITKGSGESAELHLVPSPL